MTHEPPELEVATNGTRESDDDSSSLASVILIDRREDIAGICGRVDTAPTFAVVIHAPDGNRQIATELGIRRLQRHVEDSGKVIAIATPNVALGSRARQAGIPVARRPEHVRWDSGGRRVVRMFGRSLAIPKLGRLVQTGVILVIALIFVALAVTLAPSATVSVFPPTETISRTVTITASTDRDAIDFDQLAVPARKVSATQHVTLAIRTTGTVSVGVQPAKASVTITNPAASETTVPAGAILLGGPDGIPFALDAAATIAAGQTAKAAVTALTPGIVGNLAADTIKAWREEQFRALPVTNPAPAAGGTNEDRPAVDAHDIQAIQQMANDLTKSDAVRATLLTSRPHDAIFLKTAQADVDYGDPSTPAGTAADILLLDVDVTVKATAVLEGTLNALALRVLQVNQGIGEFIPGTVSAVETGARQVDAEAKTIRTEVLLKGDFARNVTRDSIRDAVLGKDTAGAKSTLAERYGIQDADVSVSPGWMPWLPRFGFRVSVELRSRAAEDASASKGASKNASSSGSPTPAASATAGP